MQSLSNDRAKTNMYLLVRKEEKKWRVVFVKAVKKSLQGKMYCCVVGKKKKRKTICSIFEYLFKYLFNRKSFKHKAGLSMNDMRSHLHTATHASIYLGVLLSYMRNFIWWVNCTPTLQQVCYVIILQIIHLQLHVAFPFAEIHCIILYLEVSTPVWETYKNFLN